MFQLCGQEKYSHVQFSKYSEYSESFRKNIQIFGCFKYLRIRFESFLTCVRRRTLTWRRLWRAGPGLTVQKSDFECGHDDYGHDFYDDEGEDEGEADDEDADEKDEGVFTFN